MRLNKDDAKIVGATMLVISTLFVGTSLLRGFQSRNALQNDSAVLLAQSSVGNQKEHLKEKAQQLGDILSAEVITSQWKSLGSRMIELGATSETTQGIRKTITTSEHSTISKQSLSQEQLWPLAVDVGYVKNNKVWVVHLGYWVPARSTTRLTCGTGMDDPFRMLAYRTYIIDDVAPNHCWLAPVILRLMSPDEQKNYIRDNEYLDDL